MRNEHFPHFRSRPHRNVCFYPVVGIQEHRPLCCSGLLSNVSKLLMSHFLKRKYLCVLRCPFPWCFAHDPLTRNPLFFPPDFSENCVHIGGHFVFVTVKINSLTYCINTIQLATPVCACAHACVCVCVHGCASVFVSLLQSSFISSKEKRDTSVDNIKQTKREKMKITGCFVLHSLLQLSAL